MTFPAFEANGASEYDSIGCDWLMEKNPVMFDDSKTIGTPVQVARCHKNTEKVLNREYNPLERGWCRDQALDPKSAKSVGPYLDADNADLWLLTVGKAVYDRVTGEFIACTLADVTIAQIVTIVDSFKIGNTSQAALVRWDNAGTVVASTLWDPTKFKTTVAVTSLDMGVDQSTFNSMKSLEDFKGMWRPATVKKLFKDTFYKHKGKLISTYPIPTPPDVYDEAYEPEYLIILTIDEQEIVEKVDIMDDAIDKDVKELVSNSIIASMIGLACIIGIVVTLVARVLTAPLIWMDKVAGTITNNAGGNLDSGVDPNETPDVACSPETEITDLVQEFKVMVAGFGGSGAAKVATNETSSIEVFNIFGWNDFVKTLYTNQTSGASSVRGGAPLRARSNSYAESIEKKGHKSHFLGEDSEEANEFQSVGMILSNAAALGGESVVDDKYTRHVNLGTAFVAKGANVEKAKAKTPFAKSGSLTNSRLFWWVVLAIVVPLLCVLFGVSYYVADNIQQELPTWLGDVKEASVALEKDAIKTTAKLRAVYAQEIMAQPIRDLHLYTRTAGWLYFGGLERSSAFTRIESGTEDCKLFTPGKCPYVQEMPCDCDWYDATVPSGTICKNNYTDGFMNGRETQVQQFSVQAMSMSNADKSTGVTTKHDMPTGSTSAAYTTWRADVTKVPGNEKGAGAAGYSTTYDRLRVSSALSVVEFPLYNYYSPKDYSKQLGTFIGFEADGLYSGYAGCSANEAENSLWVSDIFNRAAEVNADLCPIGKYGFDPRCRDWYARCAFFDRNLHSRMPLVPTPARLKRACV
jgi:hypothetical protein